MATAFGRSRVFLFRSLPLHARYDWVILPKRNKFIAIPRNDILKTLSWKNKKVPVHSIIWYWPSSPFLDIPVKGDDSRTPSHSSSRIWSSRKPMSSTQYYLEKFFCVLSAKFYITLFLCGVYSPSSASRTISAIYLFYLFISRRN